jgi:hypothetical protein
MRLEYKATMTAALRSLVVPAEYLPLFKYLDGRYADTVVLTMAEIEDLLNMTLPDPARVELGWWGNPDAAAAVSPQSRSWIKANRTAVPNLKAQIVVFDRTSA